MARRWLGALLGLALLAAAPPAASATTILLEEDGESRAFTSNKDAGFSRPVPYRTKDIAISQGEAYVQQGTQLELVIPKAIRGEDCRQGDTVVFRLAEDLVVNGAVLAPRNASVFGRVTRSVEPALGSRVAELEISMDSLYTCRDVRLPLHAVLRWKDDVLERRAIAGGFLVYGTRIRVPKGTRFLAEVTQDTGLGITIKQIREFGIYYGVDPRKRTSCESLVNLRRRPY